METFTATYSATWQQCSECGWWIRASGSAKAVRWAGRMFQKHACYPAAIEAATLLVDAICDKDTP